MTEVQEQERVTGVAFAEREPAPLTATQAQPEPRRVAGTVVQPKAPQGETSDVYFTEQVGDLVTSLAKAQGRFGTVEKAMAARVKAKNSDAQFDITWADLAAFFEAVRGPLSEEGIFYAQFPKFSQAGVRVQTILFKGEQRIWNYMFMPYGGGGNDAWTVASATTYAKRYGFGALLGIASEHDDDGARASGQPHTTTSRREAPQPAPRRSEAKPPQTEAPKATTPKATPKPAPQKAAPPADPEIKNDKGKVSAYQFREADGVGIARLDNGSPKGQVVYTKNPTFALALEGHYGAGSEVTVTSRQNSQDQTGVREIVGMMPAPSGSADAE